MIIHGHILFLIMGIHKIPNKTFEAILLYTTFSKLHTSNPILIETKFIFQHYEIDSVLVQSNGLM